MGFFKSAKGSIISEYFKLLCDVGQMKKDNVVDVQLYEDHLALSAPMSQNPITLRYAQITDVYYGLETEIQQKNKSVVKRALLGGLLFGGVGAIVGGISGNGTKEKKVNKFIFIISYTSSSGADAFLQFEDTRLFKGQKLANILKEKCSIDDSSNNITEL